MATIDLYGMQPSAPMRIVQMTCECLGVAYNFKKVDLMTGEHMTPEFLKINPMHNIPTMVDGDVSSNESRAIATYLVSKYGKDDKLYPKDVETRLRVDQRLYFDMGAFYKAFGDMVYPVMFPAGGAKLPGEKEQNRLKEVLGWLNGWVADGKYAAGTDHMTLADISLLSTFATLKAAKPVDLAPYENLDGWVGRCTPQIPNYEKANGEGASQFGGWYASAAEKK